MPAVVVDAGPLVAWADAADPDHEAARQLFQRADLDFLLASLALAEAAYLVGQRVSARAELGLVRGLASFEVHAPTSEDMHRMAELMQQHIDFPLGATDASIVALAERLDIDTIATLDHAHFRAIRPRHLESFTLLP